MLNGSTTQPYLLMPKHHASLLFKNILRIPLERNSQSAIAVRLSAPNGKFLH